MPPHPLHEKEHPLPPHEREKKHSIKSVIISAVIGSIFTALIGLILFFFKISVNVILPVLAPIWVGSTSLVYMVLSKHH